MFEIFAISKDIKTAVNYIAEKLNEKGLISIYVGGSILTKERTKDSDINLFGIVESDFDMFMEQIINSELEGKTKYPIKFRAIPLCSLEGGEHIGVIKFFHPERFIQKLPFFKHVYGKKFNFKKDFPLKPMDLKKEALFLMDQIKQSINDIREEKEEFQIQDFPKHVMELVRVEAQKEHGFEYLTRHLENEENHIVHEAYAMRYKKPSRLEWKMFCDKVEQYIIDLKRRVDEWD